MTLKSAVELACNVCFDSYREESVLLYNRVKIENENSVAYFVETEYYNILVFRGTDQTKDWLENLMAIGSRTKTIKIEEEEYNPDIKPRVHAGFHRAFRRLKNKVETVVKNSPDKQWIITGHSLGGAVASVAALLLNKIKNPMLITFGAPDWGNYDANWAVEKRTKKFLRFVNGYDIICSLYRFLFTKSTPAIRLRSENYKHPVKAHLEYRQALGLNADW